MINWFQMYGETYFIEKFVLLYSHRDIDHEMHSYS